MPELKASEVAFMMNGRILQGNPEILVRGYSVDSRTIKKGELFFALKGVRDGHDFVEDALVKGGIGAVVSRRSEVSQKNKVIIQVDDTLRALQNLAKKVVEKLKPKVVGITGSIGKTTVKENTFYLLSKFKKCIKSLGNLNNHVGLPLSILNIDVKDEVAILEMAMSSKGEIKLLTEIAPPDIAVLTNVNPVHLQFFSSVEEIALAKKEILEGTRDGGIAVLNGDDQLVRKVSLDFKGEKVFYGEGEENDIRIEEVKRDGEFGIECTINLRGEKERFRFKPIIKPLLINILPALGVGYAFGFRLKDFSPYLSGLRPFSMRGEIYFLKNIVLINDSYNSNPKALETMLEELFYVRGKRKIAVLGDMLELGEREEEFHRNIGKAIVKYGIDNLITVGELSKFIGDEAIKSGMGKEQIFNFSDSESVVKFLKEFLSEGDIVLVKGSRKMRMEIISEKLKKGYN
ncbi:MAG: UDP-N-acetylmuramoyl-tripeptide--D-alanyl-D-alanine ligase [Candidatus Aminicenantia bacterium]